MNIQDYFDMINYKHAVVTSDEIYMGDAQLTMIKDLLGYLLTHEKKIEQLAKKIEVLETRV